MLEIIYISDLTIFKILATFTPIELLQAIHDDWSLFMDKYGPEALFQALHDARLDLSQIIRWVDIISSAKYLIFSNIYTDLTIEELLQQLNPLYQLNEIVAGFAQVSNFKDYSESNEWGLKHWI